MGERGEFNNLGGQAIGQKKKYPLLIGILGRPVETVITFQGLFTAMNASYLNLVRFKEDGMGNIILRRDLEQVLSTRKAQQGLKEQRLVVRIMK